MKHKLTRKQAMDAFCAECIYDEGGLGNGTKHQQIEDCTSPECPLYEWRPVTNITKNERKQAAYEALSSAEKLKYDQKAQATRERFAENLLK